jgi:hypothetical protein
MAVEDAIELGRRAIYHATFRDCASGGTVSGACAGMPQGRGMRLIAARIWAAAPPRLALRGVAVGSAARGAAAGLR